MNKQLEGTTKYHQWQQNNQESPVSNKGEQVTFDLKGLKANNLKNLKIKIWEKNGLKIKISLDLIENLYTSQFEGAEYESEIFKESGIGI